MNDKTFTGWVTAHLPHWCRVRGWWNGDSFDDLHISPHSDANPWFALGDIPKEHQILTALSEALEENRQAIKVMDYEQG